MKLSEFIQNGIHRLETDTIDRSSKNLIAVHAAWFTQSKKLEEEHETYQTELFKIKKHFNIMFQRDISILNKFTIYTIVTKALEKHE